MFFAMFKDMKGFTLIELMIVVSIIGILAAIMIPNLITGRIAANETSAIATLRTLTSQEIIWRERNFDGNLYRDYWTYDVSCFHRLQLAGGNKVSMIDISVARADFSPSVNDAFGAIPTVENWSTLTPVAKAGYYFRMMQVDYDGNNYSQNTVGTNDIPAANTTFFGIMAAPSLYGKYGVNSYIVNQEGIIYAVDCGGDANKWKTTSAWELRWPAKVPSSTNGPAGSIWSSIN